MHFPSDYGDQRAGQKWKENSGYQFSAFGDFTFLTINKLSYEVINMFNFKHVWKTEMQGKKPFKITIYLTFFY